MGILLEEMIFYHLIWFLYSIVEIDNKDGFIGMLGEKDYKKVDMKHNGTSVTLS